MLCFDADERVTGDLRGFLQGPRTGDCEGIRVRLFDAYMTPDDCAPYQSPPRTVGLSPILRPEQRDILMLWRNREKVYFAEQHAREPGGISSCGPSSTANTMASRCRSSIGRKPATTTFGIFRLRLTDENGLIEKVRRSIPDPISCGRCTNGVKRCLRMRSRFDLVIRFEMSAPLSALTISAPTCRERSRASTRARWWRTISNSSETATRHPRQIVPPPGSPPGGFSFHAARSSGPSALKANRKRFARSELYRFQSGPSAGFRTIQVCPKDLPPLIMAVFMFSMARRSGCSACLNSVACVS